MSFCFAGWDVVFNKIMVSLDFFCFVFVIKQKNEGPRFVATEAHLLIRRNDMKEYQASATIKKKQTPIRDYPFFFV